MPPPKYRRIAQDIRDRISCGDLAPGSKVPTERDLADQYGVSRSTVTKALDLVRGEGLVRSQLGSGTYVVAPPPLAAPTISADSWLQEGRFADFRRGYAYAAGKLQAIPGLAKLTPEEAYYVWKLIQRGTEHP